MNLKTLDMIYNTNVFDLKLNIHNLTDKEWQNIFHVMQLKVPTSNEKKLKRNVRNNIIGRKWSLNTTITSQDGYYCNYINDVLRNIRTSNTDYCYYIYQIIELIRFEPKLHTKLIHDGELSYFEVWI
jgi:hypothetical protein